MTPLMYAHTDQHKQDEKPDVDTPIILGLMAGIASIVVITSIAIIFFAPNAR